jgi:hypothetical protein
MIGGAAPHIVSAARMEILILRENIYPFFECDCRRRKTASDGEKGATSERETFPCSPGVRLEYTPGEGIFSE